MAVDGEPVSHCERADSEEDLDEQLDEELEDELAGEQVNGGIESVLDRRLSRPRAFRRRSAVTPRPDIASMTAAQPGCSSLVSVTEMATPPCRQSAQ